MSGMTKSLELKECKEFCFGKTFKKNLLKILIGSFSRMDNLHKAN
jgi:hypothetical protein